MKRALIIAASVLCALAIAAVWAWPRYVAILTERHVAKRQQANHLPENALHAIISDSELKLFSIDCEHGVTHSPTVPAFHGWPVLGQTTVVSSEQRQQLADTLELGCSRWSGREIVACFSPRHAIRASDGEQTFDLLICFECGQIYDYAPDSEKIRYHHIRIKPGVFDDILAAAGVPRLGPPQHP